MRDISQCAADVVERKRASTGGLVLGVFFFQAEDGIRDTEL